MTEPVADTQDAEALAALAGDLPKHACLHDAMVAAARDMARVGLQKDKTAKTNTGSYPYRGIDGVMNLVGPIIARHGILCIPKIRSAKSGSSQGVTADGKPRIIYEAYVEMDFEFRLGDEAIVGSMPAYAANLGGKEMNAAISYAARNFMILAFTIPIQGGLVDGEAIGNDKPSGTPQQRNDIVDQAEPLSAAEIEVIGDEIRNKTNIHELQAYAIDQAAKAIERRDKAASDKIKAMANASRKAAGWEWVTS